MSFDSNLLVPDSNLFPDITFTESPSYDSLLAIRALGPSYSVYLGPSDKSLAQTVLSCTENRLAV